MNGLERLGFQVFRMQRPCDLLVRHRASGKLDILEVDGITKNRKREPAQLDFLREWEVPQVQTLDEALKALGSRIL